MRRPSRFLPLAAGLAFAGGAAGAVAVGCSAFEGEDERPILSDASTTDAVADGPAAVTPDGAILVADAGAPRFCNPDAQVLFHETFAGEESLVAKWPQSDVTFLPTRAVTEGNPPPAILVAGNRHDGGGNTFRRLLRREQGRSGAGRLCVELDLWLDYDGKDTFGPAASTELVTVRHRNVQQELDVHYLEVKQGGLVFVKKGGTELEALESFVVQRAWNHVGLRFTYGIAPAVAELNGHGVALTTLAPSQTNGITLEIGIDQDGRDGSAGPIQAKFDNVHVVAEPL